MSASPPPKPRLPSRTLADLSIAGAFALLILMAFWPVVTGARSFFHLDLRYEHLPVWHMTQQALRSGESPFWLDGEYCGHPPLFHQEAPLFYPLTVPLLLTGAPVHRLADLFSLFHFWLGGLAAFLFVRDQTRHWTAALFAGVAWMLSVRMVQSALWPNAVAVSALLPAVLLGVARIGRGERRSGVLWVAMAGGLALLAARPHVLLGASPILLGVSVAAVASSSRPRRAVGDLALAALLALALGAPSLAPTAALYPESSRGEALPRSERDHGALTPGAAVADLFVPPSSPPGWPEAKSYPGLLVAPLFLAGGVLVLRRRPNFPRAVFAGIALGGLTGVVLAFGEKGPYGLIAELPLVSGFRVPVRYLVSWALALPLGAGIALAGILGRSRQRARVVGALCVAALGADLAWQARRSAPTAPATVHEIEPLLVEALRRRLGNDAVGFPRRYLSMAATVYPIAYSGREQEVVLREYETMKWAIGMRWGLEAVNGYGPTLRRTREMLEPPSGRAAELAGVGILVVEPPREPGQPDRDLRQPELVDHFGLARAILVPEARVVAPDRAVRAALDPAMDPRRTAILEEGEPLAADPAWDDSRVSVRLRSRRPGRAELDVESPGRAVLVVFNSFESGWSATVDGRPAPVIRADGAFQGVHLPGGRHRVSLAYRPPGLREGLGIGLAGLLALVLAAIRLPLEAF